MEHFGFTIGRSRTIEYDRNDNRLLQFIIRHEPGFSNCISCGGCTATCIAGNLTDFNVRKMNMLLRRGEIAHISEEIDKCMLCGKCYMVCPRGINTRAVIMLIKKGLTIYEQLETGNS